MRARIARTACGATIAIHTCIADPVSLDVYADGPFRHFGEHLVGGGTSLHAVLGGVLLIVSFDTVAP